MRRTLLSPSGSLRTGRSALRPASQVVRRCTVLAVCMLAGVCSGSLAGEDPGETAVGPARDSVIARGGGEGGTPWPHRIQPVRPPRVRMTGDGPDLPPVAATYWAAARSTVFVWAERRAGLGSLVAGLSAPARLPAIVRLTDGRHDDDAPTLVTVRGAPQLVWLRREGGAGHVLAAPLGLTPVPALGPSRRLARLGPHVTGFAVLPPIDDSLELLLVREHAWRVSLVAVRERGAARVLATIPRAAMPDTASVAIEPGETPGEVAVTWREGDGTIGRVTRDADGLWHMPTFDSERAPARPALRPRP
ncbi:MAG: hypothetical protein Kow0062_23810 [Acidobacteriota bacterium]